MAKAYKEYKVTYKISGSNVIREIPLLRAQSIAKAREKALERLRETGIKGATIIGVYDRGKINETP